MKLLTTLLFLFCVSVNGQLVDRFTKFPSGGGAPLVDIFPTGDASSANSEADDVSQWDDNLLTLESIANPDSEGGSYAVRIAHNATNTFRNGRIAMTCEIGETYRLEIRIARITGNGVVGNWDGAQVSNQVYSVDFDSVSNGTYIDGEVTFTADATTVEAKFYVNLTGVTEAGEFIISELKLYKTS